MPSKVAITSSPTLVSAARERQFLALQNQSDVTMYVAMDKTAASVTIDTGSYPGLKLEPGASLILTTEIRHPILAFSGPIYAVVASGSNKYLAIQEI